MAKVSQKAQISPIAQRIMELVKVRAEGNQRTFATMVGCSQPALSRILNGKQNPGPKLLQKLSALDGVDADDLRSLVTDNELAAIARETSVPILNCLIDGPPQGRRSQMKPETLEIATTLYRPSVYAVPAKVCAPAFNDVNERMRRDDYVLIDSSTDRLRENLQRLDGRLCVVSLTGNVAAAIGLRRVWLDQEALTLKTRATTKASREKSTPGRPDQRVIDLTSFPEDLMPNKAAIQEIEVEDIFGVAIQLLRNL